MADLQESGIAPVENSVTFGQIGGFGAQAPAASATLCIGPNVAFLGKTGRPRRLIRADESR